MNLAPPLAGASIIAAGALFNFGFAPTVICAALGAFAGAVLAVLLGKKLEA